MLENLISVISVCLWPFTVFNIHVHIRDEGENFIKDSLIIMHLV